MHIYTLFMIKKKIAERTVYTDIQMQSDNPPRNCRMEAVRKVTLKNIAGILLNKNDNKANV